MLMLLARRACSIGIDVLMKCWRDLMLCMPGCCLPSVSRSQYDFHSLGAERRAIRTRLMRSSGCFSSGGSSSSSPSCTRTSLRKLLKRAAPFSTGSRTPLSCLSQKTPPELHALPGFLGLSKPARSPLWARDLPWASVALPVPSLGPPPLQSSPPHKAFAFLRGL